MTWWVSVITVWLAGIFWRLTDIRATLERIAVALEKNNFRSGH